jgi:hypothetical protein
MQGQENDPALRKILKDRKNCFQPAENLSEPESPE